MTETTHELMAASYENTVKAVTQWLTRITEIEMHQAAAEGVRIAEWLRPGLWEVLTIKLRGIEPGQVLITKSPQGRVVPKSRPLVTVAGVSQISRKRGQDGRVVKAGALGGTHD